MTHQDLTELLTEQELPDNIIKGVCKVLSVTLIRYQDVASRALVLDFIRLAVAKYPLVTAKAVHKALLDVSRANTF